SIDIDGVGELIKMGVQKGRSVKPKLKVGICGEHGGEAASVAFCHNTGFDYVSCSPYRIPLARLAAAQAAIASEKEAHTKGKAPAKKTAPAGKKASAAKKSAKRKK
ncbi:MAG: pyruvate, phosphate dikinase, partial [Nitrospinota bacterium]|nr:pyruvate, phosphate dikinase [Nitrospinota bacterium]